MRDMDNQRLISSIKSLDHILINKWVVICDTKQSRMNMKMEGFQDHHQR